MQGIVVWNEIMVQQNFCTGSSGRLKKKKKRKSTPFKSQEMTPKIALLLFEFCHKTTGMNEVTAERQ